MCFKKALKDIRRLVLYFFWLILLSSCISQKVYFNTLAESKSSDIFDIEKFNHLSKQGEYYDTLNDGTVIRCFGDDSTNYVRYETPPYPSVFQIYREFHTNGILKKKGLNFENNFGKGIWREYDKEGNLIKEKNYDEGYEYSFEDVVKFLRLRGVDLFHRYTSITRNNGVWNIVYVKGDKYPKDIYDIDIDGKTGKVLSKAKNVFQEGS